MIDVYKRIDDNTIILKLDVNQYKAIRRFETNFKFSIGSSIKECLEKLGE